MANVKLVCLAILAVCCGVCIATPMLGEKQCTWGPSFWCSNLTNANGCGAVKHCIKAVWEKQKVPEDNDSICKICVDMVTEARDQLESNQTQEDLKAVFEGSCKLIPLDVISHECVKLVDQFIPDLVETLASQMNPQVVCSVAGLCNNERIDKLLAEMKPGPQEVSVNANQKCDGCFTVITDMRSNFDNMNYDKVLEAMLKVCFQLGSYSDSCATAVFTHFDGLYSHLKDTFYPEHVCHVAGVCSSKYHQHKPEGQDTKVEITPMASVGKVSTHAQADITCDLCEQLVKHLRDILIANTTETEFKRVLDGICKQTGKFKDECLALSDQFYPVIYNFLIQELNANDVCFMAGLCHKGLKNDDMDIPIAPLVPVAVAKNLNVRVIKPSNDKVLIGKDEANSYHKPSSVHVMNPESAQLPLDRMMIQLPQNGQLCQFCQYFLHFIQVQISDANTEEKIKNLVEGACKRLPKEIESDCDAFVEAYGNAAIALLVQEIDPSQVCPMLALCPQEKQVTNVELLMTSGNGDKPNCPLCLFAVQQLETMLKNNKTEESIKNALDSLCSHLSSKLQAECTDFVETYAKQLIEMMVADFTPQEVCVYLGLCTDNKPDVSSLKMMTQINNYHDNVQSMSDHNNFRKSPPQSDLILDIQHKDVQIATNEIPDNTFNGKALVYSDRTDPTSGYKATPQCVICEFVMTQVDKELKDKATDDQIKKVVHSVCNHLPKSVSKECNDFVDKYADAVILLLTQELAPEEVCTQLSFCDQKKVALQNAILECGVCEEAVDIVEQILSNPRLDRKMSHIIEKTCYAMPAKYVDRCMKLMSVYGDSIVHLIIALADSRKVCSEIGMCGMGEGNFIQIINSQSGESRPTRATDKLLGTKNRCAYGPAFWCENQEQATECKATKYCSERVWMGEQPPNSNE